VLLSAPGFQHIDLAGFQHEHRVGFVVFTEKEVVRRHEHDRAQGEQELKDVGANSAEHGHALQEFNPRFFHGDILAFGYCAQGRQATLSTEADAAEIARPLVSERNSKVAT